VDCPRLRGLPELTAHFLAHIMGLVEACDDDLQILWASNTVETVNLMPNSNLQLTPLHAATPLQFIGRSARQVRERPDPGCITGPLVGPRRRGADRGSLLIKDAAWRQAAWTSPAASFASAGLR
jgi:hypothetical protein